MVDMFWQELRLGDVAFILDGRRRDVGIVCKVTDNNVTVCTSVIEWRGKPEPYTTTKRASDRIIKLVGPQIQGYKDGNKHLGKRLTDIEEYYASEGY